MRRPGELLYRAFAVDVLTIEDGMITDISTRLDAFGLPETVT